MTSRSDPVPRRRRRLRGALIGVALLASILLVLGAGSCFRARIPESGSRQQVLFYAAATDLSPGVRMDPGILVEQMQRLGYRSAVAQASGEDRFVRPLLTPGTYRHSGDEIDVFLRPFDHPDGAFEGGRLRLRFRAGEIDRVEPIDPMEAGDLRLEPERIAGYEGGTGAVLQPLKLSEAPPLLVEALVAIEDRRFYQHPGVDPIGMARAIWANLNQKGLAQGGSTLTQQLARSLYLHNRKTFLRKFEEMALAFGLELRYSKEEILEGYLNAVYWGHWGPMEIRGAREASLYYLGRELEQADTSGIALLVGIIPAPNAFSPYRSEERAKGRRDLVLRQLRNKGLISDEAMVRALKQPLPVRKPPKRVAEASYFLEAARREVERRAPKGILDRPGTIIFTSLDSREQAAMVEAVRQGLERLERDNRRLRREENPLQSAAVSIDPQTGEVRALVGGRDYLLYPFNRAVDARRQPGSLFKPFVYLAAFEKSRRSGGGFWTPATILHDEPIEIRAGRRTWRPQNYDRQYRGEVTLRSALEQSLNVPTAAVAQEVGIDRVARIAHDLGVASPLDEVPSLSLGTSDVSLLEMTVAYAALAAEGEAHAPTLLRAVVGPDDEIASLKPLEDPPGVGRTEAYLVTRLLEGVVEHGTARRARGLAPGSLAGKTGTTDEYRDAWFIGYTPRHAVGVWVGFDQVGKVGLAGSAAALPIWMDTMREVLPSNGDGRFERPKGIVTAPIDPESGMLATADCPSFVVEEFVHGTAPTEECDRHRPSAIDRLRRFFGI